MQLYCEANEVNALPLPNSLHHQKMLGHCLSTAHIVTETTLVNYTTEISKIQSTKNVAVANYKCYQVRQIDETMGNSDR